VGHLASSVVARDGAADVVAHDGEVVLPADGQDLPDGMVFGEEEGAARA